jgi:putative endopeptidase
MRNALVTSVTLWGAFALAACSSGSKPVASPTPPVGESHESPAITGTQVPAPAEVTLDPTLPPAPAGKRIDVSLADVGLDAKSLDKSVDPCDDFYQFACGGWEATNEIPADKGAWSRFHEIAQRNEQTLKKILEDSAKATDPMGKRLGIAYASCMNEAAVEKAGIKPIKPWFAKIDKLKTPADVLALTTELHGYGVSVLWGLSADQDAKDTSKIVAQLGQSGLGLPSRDYYDQDDKKDVRDKYLAHMEKMLVLAGMKPAAAKQAAADDMEVETAIAKLSLRTVEMRDPEKIYNKVPMSELASTAPGFDWMAYFKKLGVGGDYVTMHDKNYFKGVIALTSSIPVAKWQAYMRYQVLDSAAPLLSKAFVDENFVMSQALNGAKELAPRWKRCVHRVESELGEDLGQEFVKVAFSGDAKPLALQMVDAIKGAFAADLPALAWMDDTTRKAAMDKLGTLATHVGYTDKWKVYTFKVTKDLYATAMAASKWEVGWTLARIGKPVDRTEWGMYPQTVNAYYNPTRNEIVFPAGILQTPFFGADRAVAANLGGIGVVIGHELTHGFDDEGSQFAPDGNLKKWWPEEVRKRFDAKTACLVDEYGSFEPLPGLKLDGKLTLGENIADNGGVKLAFRAYRTLRAGAKETRVADGYTEDQQFFLGMGQVWCSKRSEQTARQYAVIDPHSPPKFRVNGSVVNSPEFRQAFQCKAGSKMAPPAAKMCRVW